MGYTEAAIESIDWSRYRLLTASAEDFGRALLQILQSRDSSEIEEVWFRAHRRHLPRA
jgi:hypothetical protein